MKKFIYLFAGLLIGFSMLSQQVSAQILRPVKWEITTEKVSESEITIIYKATIDEHWHLYSQDIIDPDGNLMAPPATTFEFEKNEGYELVGKIMESKSIEEFDKNFGMTLKYFGEEAVFTAKIKLLTKEKVVVKGYVNFMTCDDTRCLPPSDEEFEFTFNDDGAASAVAETEEIETSKNDLTGEGEKSLWGFFLISFLFGLAGILTPCVFPMIPMTVSFFMKAGDNKAKGRMEATVYGISIVAIYVFIGSVLAVVAGPGIANFLSTHWLPNILFFVIFFIFAASFFGMFEIVMPHWVVNKSTANEDKGGLLVLYLWL